ncbi:MULTISPECIES: class F sortase [unclassified Streptomyces]|uniref:class F sortase n=1 Tax=unclassified Streptomyces TaxID=2593676 RepID=UPI002E289D1D|nr:class F sortase [Streptomyces sp. NBC_01429]
MAWAVLLLGLWVWGRGVGDGLGGRSAPTTGDVAAVGRPLGVRLPPPRDPLDDAPGDARRGSGRASGRDAVAAAPPAVPAPKRVEIPSLGIAAPIVARGLDADGAVDPPPYETPGTVGWYGDGVQPGAVGAALLVGHVDTEQQAAVFYGLSAAKPGGKVAVTRADGRIAEFTIDDVRVVPRDRFDAKKVYGPREKNRAELRLITCGGTFDTKERAYTANVVVSAYLTGVKEPSGTANR